jgi:hypothetical protein
MEHEISLEQAMIATCPSRTEAASLETWHRSSTKFFPATPALDEFRAAAEDLAQRGMVRKRGDRFFDPQKTTSY